MLWSEWKDLELQIVEMNDEVERIASSDAACRRLRQVPGIGPLVATAIVASIGNGAAFRKGREFAAWMGLLPKQHSTGGKARLYGISKRGNSYLRKILIHGARAVVLRSKRDRIAMGAWMTSLETRAPRNVLIVATTQTGTNRVGSTLDGPGLSSSTRGTDSISRLSNQQHQVLPTEVCTGTVKMKEQSKRRT
jgi:transposase